MNKLNLTNLKEGEEVKLVLRRHWIALFYILLYVIFFLVSILSLVVLKSVVTTFLNYSIFWVLIILYSMTSILFIYTKFINYELDIFIVTNMRIIGIEQLSFLNRTVSECSLSKIQEVDSQTRGLLSNIFNFGFIRIGTASENSDFHLNYMPDPIENVRKIQNILQDVKTPKDDGINMPHTNDN
ncbi:MAG: hypothetical protein PHF46_03280 [Candidatus Gracilibacteria bacterium]|nr:hypothetical protein [Candidatus Gracilibacteria bacterium]MDD3120402.1 hypothetical protein [Candidatus Gracilibacteria bacterium]MDD4530721.1 hypothetical protein [Candidatus Gracilibacteria bacterium]